MGWVNRRRDHGDLIFVDLRDRWGITQVVFDPEDSVAAWQHARDVRSEYVLAITGAVARRLPGKENPHLATGAIELRARELEILNPAATPPFVINEEVPVEEALRLRYRYLDLRRPRMTRNILLRHRVIKFMRDWLDARDFIEIETPILFKSTPGGARDYLVPSRLHPGRFYALPQSPQQFKQLIMVAGFDRYFQIAPCFRDEDARADRSPGEFYQLDLEMSFVTQQDVFDAVEPVMRGVFEEFSGGKPVTKKFPQIPYQQAMLRYGTDTPDLRNPLAIAALSDEFNDASVTLNAFRNLIKAGGVVRAIPAPAAATQPRSWFDRLNDWARSDMGAAGLGYIVWEGDDGKGP